MPTPASGAISMGEVETETGLAPQMSNFYNGSLGGGVALGMYHNLTMGPGNNLTYKTAIYDPRSLGASGENLKLENWYNYSQEPNGIFDIVLTNNSTNFDVIYEFFLGPTGLSAPGISFLSGILTAGGGNRTETNFDSLVAMSVANFPNDVYNIYIPATANYNPPPPPPPPPMPPPTITATGSASDTDGVGAGLTRIINTGAINFDYLNPLPFLPIIQGNIGTGGAAGTGIFFNKRTTFSLTFA
jgi:hypothetical protein